MTIYVDLLFGLNTALNYLLLKASARLGGGSILRSRLLAAAALGGLYGVLALVPGLAPLRFWATKLLAGALMLLLAFGAKRRTIRLGLLFLAVSFSFAGLVLLVNQFLGGGLVLLETGAFYPVSMTALLLLAAVCDLTAMLVLQGLCQHGGQVVPLTLRLGERQIPIRALRDNGNVLRDPISNEPVLILGRETAERLLPEAAAEIKLGLPPDHLLLRLSACYPGLRFRLIPYGAVGTASGLLPAVRCSATDQRGRTRPILTALSPTPMGDGEPYDALTGGSL